MLGAVVASSLTTSAGDAADTALTPAWSALANWRMWLLGLGALYAAFQSHLLPNGIARVVGRAAFYPTWPLTYLSRRRDYWSLVDSHVMLGAAPMSFMGHADALYARGVRAVINLCDEYTGPLRQYHRLHMAQLHLPTIVRACVCTL